MSRPDARVLTRARMRTVGLVPERGAPIAVQRGVGLNNMLEITPQSAAAMPEEQAPRWKGTQYALPQEFRKMLIKYGASALQPVHVARSDSSHAGDGWLGTQTLAKAVAQYITDCGGAINASNAAEQLGPKLDLARLAKTLVAQLSQHGKTEQLAQLLASTSTVHRIAIEKLSPADALATYLIRPELLKGWAALFWSWAPTKSSESPFVRRLYTLVPPEDAAVITAVNFPGALLQEMIDATAPQGAIAGLVDSDTAGLLRNASAAVRYRDTGSKEDVPASVAPAAAAASPIGEAERTALIRALAGEAAAGSASRAHIERLQDRAHLRQGGAGHPKFGTWLENINRGDAAAATPKNATKNPPKTSAPEEYSPSVGDVNRSGRRMTGDADDGRLAFLACVFILTWARVLDSLLQPDELDLDVHTTDESTGEYRCGSRRSATGNDLDRLARLLHNDPNATADNVNSFNWSVFHPPGGTTTVTGMRQPSDHFRAANVAGVLDNAEMLATIIDNTEILVIEGLLVECKAAEALFTPTVSLTGVADEFFHRHGGLPLHCPDKTEWKLGSFASLPGVLVLLCLSSSASSLAAMPSWGKTTNMLARITQYKRACMVYILLTTEATLRDHPMPTFANSVFHQKSDAAALGSGRPLMTASASFSAGLATYLNPATQAELPWRTRERFANSARGAIEAVNNPAKTPTPTQQRKYDASLLGGNFKNSARGKIGAVNRTLAGLHQAARVAASILAAERNAVRLRLLVTWPSGISLEYVCNGEPPDNCGLYAADTLPRHPSAPPTMRLNLADLAGQSHLGLQPPTVTHVDLAEVAATPTTAGQQDGGGGTAQSSLSKGQPPRPKRAKLDETNCITAELTVVSEVRRVDDRWTLPVRLTFAESADAPVEACVGNAVLASTIGLTVDEFRQRRAAARGDDGRERALVALLRGAEKAITDRCGGKVLRYRVATTLAGVEVVSIGGAPAQ